jgi:hypothetical protein
MTNGIARLDAISVGEGPVPSHRPKADTFSVEGIVVLRTTGGHRSLPYRKFCFFRSNLPMNPS